MLRKAFTVKRLALSAGLAILLPAVGTSAESALKASGIRGGVCVHLGATDGRLTAALGADGRFLVHGLAASDAAVETARKHIRSRGVYGRVSVERGALERLPYADNFVNLIVVEDLPALLAEGLSLKEVLRVLAPGGAACLGKASAAGLKARLAAAGLADAGTVKRSGAWTVLKKTRPRGMDEWTHWNHGPDGGAVSGDRVGVPRSLRWQAGPLYQMGGHYYGGGAPVSAGGRLFTVTLEEKNVTGAPVQRQVLWARDAHNGMLLWRRKSGARRPELAGNRIPLVAVGDRLYATLEKNGPLLALDAATGKTVKTYEEAVNPDDWMVCGSALIVRRTPDRGANKLLCLDAAGGALRWKKELRVKDMVAAGGRLFCLAMDGEKAKELLCLDLASGARKWAGDISSWYRDKGNPTLLFCRGGVLVLGSGQGNKAPAQAHGVSAADGKHLWSFGYDLLGHGGRNSKVFFVDGLVWVNRAKPTAWVGLDPRTGKVKREHKEAAPSWSRNLCGVNRATGRFIICRTMLFVDVKSGKHHRPWGAKNACGYGGLLPANGLVYSFPQQCRCYPMLRGIIGLSDRAPPGASAGKRLERGPAYGFKGAAGAGKDDWPVYRHDARRSGSTGAVVPAAARLLWEVDLGGKVPEPWAAEWARRGGGGLSAPTVAGGLVFVARPDAHEVLALEAGGGKVRWRATVGGRVDTPPTVHDGLCLFGCSDGCVYCLRASDGKTVWRFRAAPARRKIAAFGQLESAWPVHGSVLVAGGAACVAAGRHSKIDGGAFLHALDPASGKLLWSRNPREYHGLVDLLTFNGKSICFASWHYDRKKGSGQFDPRTGATRGYKERAGDFLWGNTGLLSEMWIGNLYKAPRLSVWTVAGTSAQMLVFNDKRAFAFRAAGRKSHACLLAAGGGGGGGKPSWKVDLPKADRKAPSRLVRAMALTGGVLWVAGRLGKRPAGQVLRAYAAKDGKQLKEIELSAPPVHDGMAAAGGKLFLSCLDGKLRCFGRK